MPSTLLRQAIQSRLAARLSKRACAAATTSNNHHQRAMMCTSTTTTPLYAQPNQYVTGATSNQMEANQAMRDWYAANFPSWQEDGETNIKSTNTTNDVDPSSLDTTVTADEEDEELITTNPHNITLPPSLTQRNIRPLTAYIRDPIHESGTRNCHRLRNNNNNTSNHQNSSSDDTDFPLIPGILHGSDPTTNILSIQPTSKLMVKTPWFEIQRELDRYGTGRNGSFENRVYALTVFAHENADVEYHQSVRRWNRDETTYELDEENMTITEIPPPPKEVLGERTPIVENVLVIPTGLQLHPVAHSAICLNFVRYHANKPIQIPIRTINEEESPAMKKGGFIAFVNTFVECLVEEGGVIPEKIELECSGLRQKDVVRGERLIIPEGVRVHPRVGGDFLVGTVFGAKGVGALVDEEEGGEEAK